MASAVYDGGHALQAVRAAIRTQRRRRALPARDSRRLGTPRRAVPRAQGSRARGLLRGVGASVAIACGYVSLMSALRALLSIS
jgi:hypothetical protein